MTVRDEGATHFYGDDCSGGHRTANMSVAATQIATPDLTRSRGPVAANQPPVSPGPPDVVSDEMVDAYVRAIFTGWYIEMKGDELRQDVRAGLAAVVPLIRAQVAAEPDGGRVEYGAAHDTCEHWGSWPTAESLIAWLPDNPGWRPLIRVTREAGLEPVDLLVPTGPPRDPHAATVPFEAFVGDHPDHIDWVRDTGRCMASGPHECVAGGPISEGQERSEEQQ